jgi:hypothetical protein
LTHLANGTRPPIGSADVCCWHKAAIYAACPLSGLKRTSLISTPIAERWIKAQAQGKTIFAPDFDIDDGGGLPHEKPAFPPS